MNNSEILDDSSYAAERTDAIVQGLDPKADDDGANKYTSASGFVQAAVKGLDDTTIMDVVSNLTGE
jgi:hypothetical protein